MFVYYLKIYVKKKIHLKQLLTISYFKLKKIKCNIISHYLNSAMRFKYFKHFYRFFKAFTSVS